MDDLVRHPEHHPVHGDLLDGFLTRTGQLEHGVLDGRKDQLPAGTGIVDVGPYGDASDAAGRLKFPLDLVEILPVIGDGVEELNGLAVLVSGQLLHDVDVRVRPVGDDRNGSLLKVHGFPKSSRVLTALILAWDYTVRQEIRPRFVVVSDPRRDL